MKRQAGGGTSDAGPLAIEGVVGGVPIPISGTITGGNAAASATGAAVPSDADYQGINVGGTLRGQTGVNPTGTQYAADTNLAAVGGASTQTGHGTAAGALRVELPTDGTGVVIATQSTATNLKTQAENYQGGSAVGAANPLQVSLANTGANATPVAVSLASAPTTTVNQGTSPWIVAGGGTAGSAATGVVSVQGIASMTPVQVSQATASNLNSQAVGNIAHDTGDAGNPIKVGNKAIAYGTNPTGVTANDRTDAYANLAGMPFIANGHPNTICLRYNATAAETNTKLITVSGGTKIVMLSCTIKSDKACTVNVAARAGFAASTTPTTTGVYISDPGIAPGSGIREAGMAAGADGEDFILTSTVPTTGSIDVVMKYFTIEA